MWSRNSAGVRALREFSLDCLAVDHTKEGSEAAGTRTAKQISLSAVFMTLSWGYFTCSESRSIELGSQAIEFALDFGGLDYRHQLGRITPISST
jgi:hypothetical protein